MGYDFTPDQIVHSEHKIDARLQSVDVQLASPEMRTGTVSLDQAEMQPIIQEWEKALTIAAPQSAMFDPNSNQRVKLVVEILEFDYTGPLQLLIGHSRVTHIKSRYVIINLDTNTVMRSLDVDSIGVSAQFQGLNTIRAVSYDNAVGSNIEKYFALSSGVLR
jgi:hypothetical protein